MQLEKNSRHNQPIAIVGIGCRFPGGSDSPQNYWQLLKSGATAISFIPETRWNNENFYDPDPAQPGKMYMRKGGFLKENVYAFDAEFFGISPREAECLDPQQRLLLEVTWEAFADAGMDTAKLAGSSTGVFIGGFTLDNMLLQLGAKNRANISSHTATSSSMSLLSNRLSYFFDLKGPSISVDTACSSSLVSLHYACQSLRAGECELALCGGVNLMLCPEYPIAMCKGGFLAVDGHSKSFDQRADGYARGEGAGIVILKPLQQAIAEENQIYAVIRGSGINQDGRTGSITIPNQDSQIKLMTKVLATANVLPDQLGYIEAHGTGTPTGDPIEAYALGTVVGKNRLASDPCLIGSVKSNIGHLEAASGIAGLIKTALILKHQEIPPQANFQTPNSTIPFAELGLKIAEQSYPFPSNQGRIFAAVNSFGYGGTNANVILEAFRQEATRAVPLLSTSAGETCLLPLSAHNEAALTSRVTEFISFLENSPGISLQDICYSAGEHASHHHFRLAALGRQKQELISKLRNFLKQSSPFNLSTGKQPYTGPCKIAFVFSGMGSQWRGMGKELLTCAPAFRLEAEKFDRILLALSGWSVIEEIVGDYEICRINQTEVAQAAILMIQVSLIALYASLGIRANAVVGHSSGEIAAAYASGALSLEEAVYVCYHRSRIQKKAAGLGGMLSVGLNQAEAEAILSHSSGKVSIAATNSHNSVVLSGDNDVLDIIAADLKEKGVFYKFLAVEVPFHSQYLQPFQQEIRTAVTGINPTDLLIPAYSTVSGKAATPETFTPEYWALNIRQPVLFAEAITTMLQDGYTTFLEVGPHAVLSLYLEEIMRHQQLEGKAITTLKRMQSEQENIMLSLEKLFACGASLKWKNIYPQASRCQLPAYPWQRQEFRMAEKQFVPEFCEKEDHSLLGIKKIFPGSLWQKNISQNSFPYLAAHMIDKLVVYPGAAYLEMCFGANKSMCAEEGLTLENITFHTPLLLKQDKELILNTTFEDNTFKISSSEPKGDTSWVSHFTATLGQTRQNPDKQVSLTNLQALCPDEMSPVLFYQALEQRGLNYGPAFQNIRQLHKSQTTVLAYIEPQETAELRTSDYILHPALLDSCFQSLFTLLPTQAEEGYFVPVHIDQLVLLRSPRGGFYSYGELSRVLGPYIEGNITIYDREGNLCAMIDRIICKGISDNKKIDKISKMLYNYSWKMVAEPPCVPRENRWVLFSDNSGYGDALAEKLEATGQKEVISIKVGSKTKRETEKMFKVNPHKEEELKAILSQSLQDEHTTLVYLWNLNLPSDKEGISQTLRFAQVLKALFQLPLKSKPRLYLITSHAQIVDDEDTEITLSQPAIAGLARVALCEYPEHKVTLIDVDRKPASLEATCRELLAAEHYDDIAIRKGQRYVHQLNRTHFSHQPKKQTLPDNGSFRLHTPEHASYLLALQILNELASQPLKKNIFLAGDNDALADILLQGAGLYGLNIHPSLNLTDTAARDEIMLTTRGKGIEVLIELGGVGSRKPLYRSLIPGGLLILATATAKERFAQLDSLLNDKQTRILMLNSQQYEQASAADLQQLYRETTSKLAAYLQQKQPHRFTAGDYEPELFYHILSEFCPPGLLVAPGQVNTLFDPEASYLVTGAFGGAGRLIVRWMTEHGARNLILVGRTGVSAGPAVELMDDLAKRSINAHVLALDITDKNALFNQLTRLKAVLPVLKGVIHAAAVIDDALLINLDESRFRQVMEPKIRGTVNLHLATCNDPLDFFIMFSSIASIIGNGRQGNYVAGNSFMDAFTHYRRFQGLPATTINWGALSTGGMDESEKVRQHFANMGLGVLAPSEFLLALEQVVRYKPAQLGIFDFNWAQWQKYDPQVAASARFSKLVPTVPLNPSHNSMQARQAVQIQRQSILSTLQEELKTTLHLTTNEIDQNRPLLSLGIDSIMANELKFAIQRQFAVDISTLEIMKGITLAQLVTLVEENLANDCVLPTGSQSGTGNYIHTFIDQVDKMTEAEIDTMLNKILA